MLKQVQHDIMVRFRFFCHPEPVSGSRFWGQRIYVLKPPPRGAGFVAPAASQRSVNELPRSELNVG